MKGKWVFDELVEELHGCFERLPDYRTGENTQYEIKDAALGAFSVFFAQEASFLSYQRKMAEGKGQSNLQNLFRAERVPSDNQIRNLLDPLEPGMLSEVFSRSVQELEALGVLDEFRSYDERLLISCDGTQTVSSQKVSCENCSTRELSSGEIQYAHTAILPVIVKAGERRVIALEPEFIRPQDGHAKQDCERAAIKRWVQRHAGEFAKRRSTLLGDDLYACQPICELFLEAGFDFILVCKPDSHVGLYQQVEFLAKNGLVEQFSTREWSGRFWKVSQYRFVNQVPLRQGEDALAVNWCEVTITREDTGRRLYKNTFVTNHELKSDNVPLIVRDGRARWKSENETNNVLKTKGYHLKHNFGHGDHSLANFLVTLNLLAFLFHTLLDLLDEQYRTLRKHIVTRIDFFNDLRALLRYMLFDDWNHLMRFMLIQLEIIPDT
jgi:hypothetical protein